MFYLECICLFLLLGSSLVWTQNIPLIDLNVVSDMQCVVSWNNEKDENMGDVVRVFKDSEGYWDFESVTDENEYMKMKSNSELVDFLEFSNAQDYITFKEYRDGNYGEINVEYSYCAPAVNDNGFDNGFDNNQFITQNFMPTYLGGSSMPMYMPYGDMFMPIVASPLIPIPIFIGGTLIGWRRNSLFFGRRFMPGFGGAGFIRRGLWDSMIYGLRTRRYGSPTNFIYMDNGFNRQRNRLPPIGFSMNPTTNGRIGRFKTRKQVRNGSRRPNGLGRGRSAGMKIRERKRFGSQRNNKFNDKQLRGPGPNGQVRPFNPRPNMPNRGGIKPNNNGPRQPGQLGPKKNGSFDNRRIGRPGFLRPGRSSNQRINTLIRESNRQNVNVRPNLSNRFLFNGNQSPGFGRIRNNIQQRNFQNLRNGVWNNRFQVRNQQNFRSTNRFNMMTIPNRNKFPVRNNSINFSSRSNFNRPRPAQRNNFSRSISSRSSRGNGRRNG